MGVLAEGSSSSSREQESDEPVDGDEADGE